MKTTHELRESIFRHLDGIAIVPIASILKEKGITDYLLKVSKISIKELSDQFKINDGYLNVVLRALASQGFLDYEVDNVTNEITISVNDTTSIAFSQFHQYEEVANTLFLTDAFTANVINSHSISILSPLFEKYKKSLQFQPDLNTIAGQIEYQIIKHI